MRDLQKLFRQCCEELDVIGVPYSHNITKVSANGRYTTRYGNCTKYCGDGHYEIQIAKFLLSDKLTDDRIVRATIFHELIHTCDGCMNHGERFHYWGNLVSDCYDVEITTTVSRERAEEVRKAGLTHERRNNWVFECVDCGQEWHYTRKPKFCSKYEANTMIVPYCSCPKCDGKIRIAKGVKATMDKLDRVYTF